MSTFGTKTQEKEARPCIQVHLDEGDASWTDRLFAEPFRIGRGSQCEVQVQSGMVSREHAEVVFEDGEWWIQDLGSTNGLFVDGTKTERARIEDATTVQLGRNAPVLRLSLDFGASGIRRAAASQAEDHPAPPDPERPSADTIRSTRPSTQTIRGAEGSSPEAPSPSSASTPPPPSVPLPSVLPPSAASTPPPPDTPPVPPPVTPPATPPSAAPPSASTPGGTPPSGPSGKTVDPSMSQIIERYFESDANRPAGEHTMMIRRAYTHVKQKQQRKYTGVILGVLGVLLVVLGFAVFQTIRNQRLEGRAADFLAEMKQQELETAQLRLALLGSENADLRAHIRQLDERQRQHRAEYEEGFVQELGLYRKLTDEERLIYRTARIFNESDLSIPAGFVREVREMIRNYWLSPAGRSRFSRGVQRAEERGYTPIIVETMQRYGLPPEFFYLSLQESNFDTTAVGPATRWGIAKGMWQFIPSTGQQYGLRIGPRADTRVVDPLDERADPVKATDAAARYLLYIYSTPAQASGLLVMASYNWGEHRVISKLAGLENSQDAIDVFFEGIAENPDERNYWRFLTAYEDRMPDETKDYVLKIFSAAVIGQDPRFFGFDFDNPLKPYMERAGAQTN